MTQTQDVDFINQLYNFLSKQKEFFPIAVATLELQTYGRILKSDIYIPSDEGTALISHNKYILENLREFYTSLLKYKRIPLSYNMTINSMIKFPRVPSLLSYKQKYPDVSNEILKEMLEDYCILSNNFSKLHEFKIRKANINRSSFTKDVQTQTSIFEFVKDNLDNFSSESNEASLCDINTFASEAVVKSFQQELEAWVPPESDSSCFFIARSKDIWRSAAISYREMAACIQNRVNAFNRTLLKINDSAYRYTSYESLNILQNVQVKSIAVGHILKDQQWKLSHLEIELLCINLLHQISNRDFFKEK